MRTITSEQLHEEIAELKQQKALVKSTDLWGLYNIQSKIDHKHYLLENSGSTVYIGTELVAIN